MPQMIESLERGIDGFCPSSFNKPFVRILELYNRGEKTEAERVFEKLRFFNASNNSLLVSLLIF